MSFLKITNPQKRDEIFNDFLQTRKNIQQSNLLERVGDIEMKREFGKIFAPITEKQEEVKKEIKSIPKAIESIPAIEYSEPQKAIEDSHIDTSNITNLGPLATHYMQNYMADRGDKIFGFYTDDGKFYIGSKEINFDNNDINIEGKKYTGTPGLWDLLTSKDPQNYQDEDLETYATIMNDTNAIHMNNDPNNPRPKSSRSKKYNTIIKPIWHKTKGSGICATGDYCPIPSDPTALIKRLNLLMASKNAGNTGVNDEIVSILDELKKQQ